MTTQPTHTLPLTCNKCSFIYNKSITLINPGDFCDSTDATILIQYRCEKCNSPQAFRLIFLKDETNKLTVAIQERINPSSVKVQPTPIGITVRPRQKSYR